MIKNENLKVSLLKIKVHIVLLPFSMQADKKLSARKSEIKILYPLIMLDCISLKLEIKRLK